MQKSCHKGGLAAKLDELSVILRTNSVDIACITETWCQSTPERSVPEAQSPWKVTLW